jgi:hypothetical protein
MCATAGKRRKKIREPEITGSQVFQEALAAPALSTAASLLKRKTGSGMVKWRLKPAAEVWINPPENRPQVRTLELPRDSKFVSQVSQSH